MIENVYLILNQIEHTVIVIILLSVNLGSRRFIWFGILNIVGS